MPTFLRPGLVDYEVALAEQRRLHDERAAGRIGDTILLLEHPPVYTAGRRTEAWERPADGTPVVEIDRGGKITWHGPGQLVGYPIVWLPPLHGHDYGSRRVDVIRFVRDIEEAIIAVCADFGVASRRVEGRTGVWTADGERKLCAIGIHVSWGVATHGFALNCNPDLSWFDRIVPCGITDATVTSLSREVGEPVTVDQALPYAEKHLAEILNYDPGARR